MTEYSRLWDVSACVCVCVCVCVSLRWLDGHPVHAAPSMITSAWSGRWRGARSDTWQKVKVSWVRTNREGRGASGPAGASFQWNIFHYWLFLLWKWEIRASTGLLRNRSDPFVGVQHPEGNPDTMQEERLSPFGLYSACSEVQFLYKSMEAITLSLLRLRSSWVGASLGQSFKLIEFSEICHRKKQGTFSVAPQQLIT